MNLSVVCFAIYLTLFGNVAKASNFDTMVKFLFSNTKFVDYSEIQNPLQNEKSRVNDLEETIEMGKAQSYTADRDLHEYWSEFDAKRELFDSTFDDLICTKPEDLREIHNEMNISIQKVSSST